MQNESKPIKLSGAKQWAGGSSAVASSLKHILTTAGAIRGTKALLNLNQTDGFDCPSCAWPDPDDHRATTEFCENGAKAIASEATSKLIDDRFFRNHSVPDLLEKSDYWHDQQGRLGNPMILRPGETHYQPISWDDAFQLLGSTLRSLADPNQAVFYTSGRTSNETAFLYQLMARHFGTNNLPDCSNMCHESSGSALNASIGIGKGTVSLDDLHHADTIIVVGQNPGTNHPRMLASLETCIKNGGKIIAINPLKEAGLIGFAHPQTFTGLLNRSTPLASQYLQVHINGDMALFRGIAKVLLQREQDAPGSIIDQNFITTHTAGFLDYRSQINDTSWEQITAISGISQQEIETLTDTILANDRKLITCWAMGITQHKNAVATIREISNIHLMLGAIGRPGAGLCPVRGHSNVQGDRTMGIFEKIHETFHLALEKQFHFSSPRQHGYDVVQSIQAMHQKKVKVFIALGGNFLQATPDTELTAEALQNCELVCHISTKLNRSHLITGKTSLILPCLGRSDRDLQETGEQFVSCENSMGIVHMSQGKLTPLSKQMLSEPMIIARLAEACVGDTTTIKWTQLAADYDRIRDLIEAVIPGFENFNQRIRKPGGFYLPNAPKQRIWNTPNNKANFSTAPLTSFCVAPDHLTLQTIRSHDQYNTTIYGLNDRYRGIGNDRMIIFLNPEDMQSRSIKPLTPLRVTSHWHEQTRSLDGLKAIPYDMPPGTAAAYFPEANVLIPIDSTADISNTPTSKSIEISIRPL